MPLQIFLGSSSALDNEKQDLNVRRQILHGLARLLTLLDELLVEGHGRRIVLLLRVNACLTE